MRSFLTLIASLVFFTAAYAQIGVRSQFVTGKYNSTSLSEADITSNGIELAGGYWFRLKNLRIEFFPELTYAHLSSDATADFDETTFTRFGIAFPVSVYPFELKGDCQCPTFSKQNDLVKKGFFLQVVPTLANERLRASSEKPSEWHQDVQLGFGAGLDIGVSDLLTLTPLIHYFTNLYSTQEDAGLRAKSDLRAGVRAIIRLDYR